MTIFPITSYELGGRWTDWVPVKNTGVAGKENTYDEDGAQVMGMIANPIGTTPWQEYVPVVYVNNINGTDADAWDVGTLTNVNNGFIPSMAGAISDFPIRIYNFADNLFPTSTLTFTRAGNRSASVKDYRGYLWYCKANEMRMVGLRRVENLLVSNSNTPTDQVVPLVTVSETIGNYILSFTGTGSIDYYDAIAGTLSGTGANDRVFVVLTPPFFSANLGLTISGDVRNCQVELVKEGQITPSEYVTVGIGGSPVFNGYFADGVKYFETTSEGGPFIPRATREGLLIERSRANIVRDSELFDTSGFGIWLWSGVTGVANSGVSPYGLNNAIKFTDDFSGATLEQGLTANNSQYSISVYAKKINHDFLRITWSNGSRTSSISAAFNLITGVATGLASTGTGVFSSAFTIPAGNGWFRLVLVGQYSTSSSTGALIIDSCTDSSGGASIQFSERLLWGAQINLGLFPISFIPTFGVSVTKAAEVCRDTLGFAPLTEGTLITDHTNYSYAVGNASDVAWMRNSSSTEFVQVTVLAVVGSGNQPNVRVTNSGVTQFDSPVGNYSSGFIKTGVAWKLNDFAGTSKAITPVVDTLGNVPSTMDFGLEIGSGVAQLNMSVRSITIYDKRLNNNQLQALTA